MLVKTRVLDVHDNTAYECELEVDAISLMLVAESREDMVRERGADWAAAAVPVLAREMVTSMQAGKPKSEIEREAVDVAMTTWLFGSIYGGLDAETFVRSDLHFNILPDGTVVHNRVIVR